MASDDVLQSFEDRLGSVFGSPQGIVRLVLVALVVAVLFTSFFSVAQDEQALVLRLGKYHRTAGPGLHLKYPFDLETVVKDRPAEVRQEAFGFIGDKRGLVEGRSAVELEDESLMLTGDLNVADVKFVVQYDVSDLRKFKFNVKDDKVNVRDISLATMRRVVGDRTVNEVLTIGKEEIANEAKRITQDILDRYQMGIRIISVLLQDVSPPKTVQPSFNDVNAARQEQEQRINRAEAERNRRLPEAQGRSKQLVAQAEGEATALVNRAQGDATRLSAILSQFAKAPEATRLRLQLETSEELLSRLGGSVTVVDPSVKGLILPLGGSMSPVQTLGAVSSAASTASPQLSGTEKPEEKSAGEQRSEKSR